MQGSILSLPSPPGESFIQPIGIEIARLHHGSIGKCIEHIEDMGIGKGKVNYRLRDAVFSRQRFWGEPFPVYYKGDTPYLLDDDKRPVAATACR